MPNDEESSFVYTYYVLIATRHEEIKTGAYLALAGVIALLLSFVLLSIISICLLHRKQEKISRLMTRERVQEDNTLPHRYSHLPTVSIEKEPTLRRPGSDGHYAKPFKPGAGISLSGHFNDDPCLGPHTETTRHSLTSLNIRENVLVHDITGAFGGNDSKPGNIAFQSKGNNSDSDDYEPVFVKEDYGNRMEKYKDEN